MALQPGDTLERYEIEGVLGQGGMGVVYRARDSRLNRRVALKVLHEGAPLVPGSQTSGPARILREARAAAMLEHPNVVAIYDVGEIMEGAHTGIAYLAMECVDGRSLRSYVGDPSVPIAARTRWLADVARGLNAAHERTLVHRDMKPENVIVRTDGTAKVLDFGIAKQSFASVDIASGAHVDLRTATGEGLVIGTPLYMAPEQMRGRHIDAKVDQFAWGVVAYELLTGVLPWGTKLDAIALVAAVLSNTPDDPRNRNPAIPAWLAAIVLRTLSKSAGERFPSMGDVVAALEAGEAGSVSDRPQAGSVSDRPQTAGSVGVTLREPAIARPAGEREWLTRRTTWLLGMCILVGLAVVGAAFARARGHGSDRAALAPATVAVDRQRCTSHSACSTALGEPAVCAPNEGECVRLGSEDCAVLADDEALHGDDTLWLGALYATTGPRAAEGKVSQEAVDLARRDFASARLALAASGQHVRPIGLVACDSTANVRRAASHLADDLHVPAVIDAQNSAPLIDIVGSILGPRQTLTVAPSAQSPLVTQIPHPPGTPPLVWRTANDGSESILALAKLVELELEPSLRAAGLGHTRVALVRRSDPTMLAVSERLFGALRFNGRSALENGADYREIIVEDHGSDDAAYATDLEKLSALEPNIVIGMGAVSFLHVIGPFERSQSRPGPGPYYLNTSVFENRVFSMIGKNAPLRARFFGVNPVATTRVNALLTMHLAEVFKHDVQRTAVLGPDYDAFYVLAYASYALGDRPATGPNLADAIKHVVPPGPVVDVGPSGIFQAFSRLSAGDSIDLNGAGGNLDFDVATGEHETDLAIMCIAADANGAAHDNVESGLVYVARTGELTGHLRCP